MNITYVYLVRCCDNSLYCGISNNPKRRELEHNASNTKGARYTRTRRPVRIVFLEKHMSLAEAMKRERAIKRLTKSKKEMLIDIYSTKNTRV